MVPSALRRSRLPPTTHSSRPARTTRELEPCLCCLYTQSRGLLWFCRAPRRGAHAPSLRAPVRGAPTLAPPSCRAVCAASASAARPSGLGARSAATTARASSSECACVRGGACVCACRVLSVRCAPTAQASSSERACACICAHASVRGARALLKRLIATGPHARAPKTLTPTPTFPAPPLPGSSTRLCVCSTPAPRAVRLTPPASAAPSRSARERPPNCWPAYLLGLSEPAECVPARWRRARARASARC